MSYLAIVWQVREEQEERNRDERSGHQSTSSALALPTAGLRSTKFTKLRRRAIVGADRQCMASPPAARDQPRAASLVGGPPEPNRVGRHSSPSAKGKNMYINESDVPGMVLHGSATLWGASTRVLLLPPVAAEWPADVGGLLDQTLDEQVLMWDARHRYCLLDFEQVSAAGLVDAHGNLASPLRRFPLELAVRFRHASVVVPIMDQLLNQLSPRGWFATALADWGATADGYGVEMLVVLEKREQKLQPTGASLTIDSLGRWILRLFWKRGAAAFPEHAIARQGHVYYALRDYSAVDDADFDQEQRAFLRGYGWHLQDAANTP